MNDPVENSLRSSCVNPHAAQRFHFIGRDYSASEGVVRLRYRLEPGPELEERFELPPPVAGRPIVEPSAVEPLLDALHWVAGVSYWKTACPSHMVFHGTTPDAWQAGFLTRLYRHGLAEFALCNGVDLPSRLHFPGGESGTDPGDDHRRPQAPSLDLPRRALVPIGGGKDSLVVVERLRSAGVAMHLAVVGQAPLMDEVAAACDLPLLRVRRWLAPALADLNAAGAWNGHVPITAINSIVLSLLAVVHGYGWLVFANERSADSATRVDATQPMAKENDENGRASTVGVGSATDEASIIDASVNHQYSKSLAFERDWRDYLHRYVGGPTYFSALRPWRELAICCEFAALPQYHRVFSSCNRNFHLAGSRLNGEGARARWCGVCPKCHFVFLALAPFMPRPDLCAIFGADLLDDPAHTTAFAQLLGLEGERPFECIGEVAECRAALAALARDATWRQAAVVRQLASRLPEDTPDLAQLLPAHGEHFVPASLLNAEALE